MLCDDVGTTPVKNVTLAFDDALLERSRTLAEQRKTSLNALIRSLLAHEIEQEDRIAEARAGLRRLMEESTLDMGPDYRWNRQELYAEREDRLLSRHERADLRGASEGEG